jgi:hypothetical protein
LTTTSEGQLKGASERIADYASPGTQCSAAVSVLAEHPVLCVLAPERSHRGM